MIANCLPSTLRGVITGFLHFLILVFLAILTYLTAFLRCITPVKRWRRYLSGLLNSMPVLWTNLNESMMQLFTNLDIQIIGDDHLSTKQWYLLTANHQSWSDVVILYRALNGKIPALRFFMKWQLLWVPLLGLGCWLIGFPFMRRYTKAQIEKNPSLKGKDIATTKKLCARFKEDNFPMAIISFAEGTRYTKQKANHQKSPYKHLLKPRAGGLAYTLMMMDDVLKEFLDITIIYTNKNYSFWDYLCGRTKKVIIKIDSYPINPSFLGNYHDDEKERLRFQQWLTELWQKKDIEIGKIKQNESI